MDIPSFLHLAVTIKLDSTVLFLIFVFNIESALYKKNLNEMFRLGGSGAMYGELFHRIIKYVSK